MRESIKSNKYSWIPGLNIAGIEGEAELKKRDLSKILEKNSRLPGILRIPSESDLSDKITIMPQHVQEAKK